jgi:hypothetical protein
MYGEYAYLTKLGIEKTVFNNFVFRELTKPYYQKLCKSWLTMIPGQYSSHGITIPGFLIIIGVILAVLSGIFYPLNQA